MNGGNCSSCKVRKVLSGGRPDRRRKRATRCSSRCRHSARTNSYRNVSWVRLALAAFSARSSYNAAMAGILRLRSISYDLLDNLGPPSAERIIPEFQHLAIGDLIPISPDGKAGQRVKAFEPNRWMLWGDEAGDSTWYWGLHQLDERRTRLITRVRMHYRWTSPLLLFNPLVEFTDIVMMRKCLLGIKRRAEASSTRSWSRLPEPAGRHRACPPQESAHEAAGRSADRPAGGLAWPLLRALVGLNLLGCDPEHRSLTARRRGLASGRQC